MLIASLVTLVLMLSDVPAAAATPPAAAVAAAPATTPAAPAPVDPVIAEINTLMTPYKGKSGAPLRARLGFSTGTRPAIGGEVVFWDLKVEQETACGMDPRTMAMRCLRGDPSFCRLGVAFDSKGVVTAWLASGAPEVCRQFIDKLKANG